MNVPVDVEIIADHTLLLAIPALAPAIIVVGVVVWVAMRDRRNEAAGGDDGAHRENAGHADQDGAP
jgi:hypothetical protein